MKVDASQIISALLIAAILFLFNSIAELTTSVADLSKQIAVMEEHNTSWESQMLDYLGTAKLLDSRVSKLEWTANQGGKGE